MHFIISWWICQYFMVFSQRTSWFLGVLGLEHGLIHWFSKCGPQMSSVTIFARKLIGSQALLQDALNQTLF
jgi:hypothetical protein